MNYPPVEPRPPADDESAEQQYVQVRTPDGRPVVTYIILGVTVFVYLLQYLLGDRLLVSLGARSSQLINEGQLWRLFTPALLHGSLSHIGFNMYSLYVLGPGLERFFGHKRFLALYVLSAFGGNVLSYLFNWDAISVGASTAIFGLIGAYGIFIYLNRRLFGQRARPMINNIVFIVVLNLVLGFTFNFDNWGHLGGLITGLAFGWFAGPKMNLDYTVTGYRMVDERSATAVWSTAALLAAVLSLLVVYGLMFL